MATAEETEAFINADIGDYAVEISQDIVLDGTYSQYYVTWHKPYPQVAGDTAPKSMWVRVTTANAAALQAGAILTAIDQSGNVDPNIGP